MSRDGSRHIRLDNANGEGSLQPSKGTLPDDDALAGLFVQARIRTGVYPFSTRFGDSHPTELAEQGQDPSAAPLWLPVRQLVRQSSACLGSNDTLLVFGCIESKPKRSLRPPKRSSTTTALKKVLHGPTVMMVLILTLALRHQRTKISSWLTMRAMDTSRCRGARWWRRPCRSPDLYGTIVIDQLGAPSVLEANYPLSDALPEEGEVFHLKIGAARFTDPIFCGLIMVTMTMWSSLIVPVEAYRGTLPLLEAQD